MSAILILFSLGISFGVTLADSSCSNTTLPLSPFFFADDIMLKLKLELDSLTKSAEILRLQLETLDWRSKQQTEILTKLSSCTAVGPVTSNSLYPNSCDEATTLRNQSGIHTIQEPLFGAQPFVVYCYAVGQGGGWTVIQRRVDDSFDFYLDWAAYKNGFGNLLKNFFIGLDKLYALTTAREQELWILLADFDDVVKYAKYDAFGIGNETEDYALKVLGNYSGDAGDSLSYHQGMKFSTKDKKTDLNTTNCAEVFKGAWWYNNCHASNLNGLYLKGAYPESQYAQGIVWSDWHGFNYALKTVHMMIRPKRL